MVVLLWKVDTMRTCDFLDVKPGEWTLGLKILAKSLSCSYNLM